MLVRGAGLGGLLIAIMMSAYTGIPKDQITHASISTRIFQTIGGAFKTAILTTVVQQQMIGQAATDLGALANAFDISFWWATAFAVIAVIPALLLVRQGKKEAKASKPESETPEEGLPENKTLS